MLPAKKQTDNIKIPLSNKKYTVKRNLSPRVVKIYNPKATFWDYKEEKYLDFINRKEVSKMVEAGIIELTEEKDIPKAWQKIFSEYKPGDKIAIKPNFNCADWNDGDFYKNLITSPQLISAVIEGLVKYINIPENDIIVYELARPIPEHLIKRYIPFGVTYVEIPGRSILERIKVKLKLGLAAPDTSAPVEMREIIMDESGNELFCYMPRVLTEAQHLINLPIVKSHQFGITTGPLKNHYGTVRFSNLSFYPVYLHGDKLRRSVVDINRNPHIMYKTRLIISDFLFGAYDYQSKVQVKKKWRSFPDGEIPNSLLFSGDPVAVESIVYDYIMQERKYHNLSLYPDDYLDDAMKYGLGINERGDSNYNYKKIDYVRKSI